MTSAYPFDSMQAMVVKKLLLIVLLAVSHSLLPSQVEAKRFVLENGLEVFAQEKGDTALVNIVFGIKAGSKTETQATRGAIHLLEHLVYLGSSETRTGLEHIVRIREHGAHVNAHTDQDMMTFEFSLPAEHLAFALNTLREKLFELKFTAQELEREKKVILEEIAQIRDDPYRRGANLLLEHLFPGHPYGHLIYGDSDVIQAISMEEIMLIHKRYFQPDNCAMAIVGNFSSEHIERKIQEIFAPLKGTVEESEYNQPDTIKKNVEIEQRMDLQLAHLILGFQAPDYNHPDQFPTRLLTAILGQPKMPLLVYALNGRKRVVESLQARYISLKEGGAILIHMTLQAKHIKTAKRECLRFLKQLRNFRFAKEDYLAAYHGDVVDYMAIGKNQMEYDFESFNEEGLAAANAYLIFLLTNDPNVKLDINEKLHSIRSRDLQKLAGRLFSQKSVYLTIKPNEKK